jgi:hypothetical protein
MKKRKWYCKYCGKSWNEDYLADLCKILDMEELQNDKANITNRKGKDSKRNKPDNVRKSEMV